MAPRGPTRKPRARENHSRIWRRLQSVSRPAVEGRARLPPPRLPVSDKRVLELLEKISEVCPVPTTISRVIESADTPRSHIHQLAQAIAVDPALAADTMRIANSPAFGFSGRVRDLEHAVGIVGLGEIRDMAAAMAMLAAFRSK